jgi:hypothetical protein
MPRRKSNYTRFDFAGFAAFGAAVLTLIAAAASGRKSFFSISVAPSLFAFWGGLFVFLLTVSAQKKGRFVGDFMTATRTDTPVAFWSAISFCYLFSTGLLALALYVSSRS